MRDELAPGKPDAVPFAAQSAAEPEAQELLLLPAARAGLDAPERYLGRQKPGRLRVHRTGLGLQKLSAQVVPLGSR